MIKMSTILFSRVGTQHFQNVRNSSSKSGSHVDYCLNLVRRSDYENYLCTLLLPTSCRTTAFVLRAFNVELAQIRDTVSDRKIGLMRLQFWKETLEAIYKKQKIPATPVAIELGKGQLCITINSTEFKDGLGSYVKQVAGLSSSECLKKSLDTHPSVAAVNRHNLSKLWLNRIIDAREEQLLSDAAFINVQHVESHAEKANASLFYLILESQGVKNIHADHLASHLGKAQGFVTLIRGVPFHAKKNLVYLPTDLMIKHMLSQEDILQGCREQKAKDVVFELASIANHHLETALSFRKDVPTSAMSVFLPAISMKAYLKTIQRLDFDVFHNKLQQRNSWLPLTLWINKIRQTF